MNPLPVIRLYSVQRSKQATKELLKTAEPFEALIQKYYSVKMLS
jgi:hypothetical protein